MEVDFTFHSSFSEVAPNFGWCSTNLANLEKKNILFASIGDNF